MKKIVALSLVLALTLGTTSVQAANESPAWKSAYKSYILNYLNSDNFNSETKIVLVDIDRDGIPELFAGSAYRTVNYVDMAYTFKNGKVQSIKQTGPGMGYNETESSNKTGFYLGMEAFTKGQIKVFKNKKTGKYTVIGNDGTSSAISSTSADYILQLHGTQLISQELSVASESEEEPSDYSFKGKSMSKANYDKKRMNYFSQLKQIPSQAIQLDGLQIVLDPSYEDNSLSNKKIVNQFLK